MSKIDVAENLKILRKKQGYTQQELANILKVAKTTVSTWERGAAKPRMDVASKLASLYGISVSQLIGESNLVEDETHANKKSIGKEPVDLDKALSEEGMAMFDGQPLSEEYKRALLAMLNTMKDNSK